MMEYNFIKIALCEVEEEEEEMDKDEETLYGNANIFG